MCLFITAPGRNVRFAIRASGPRQIIGARPPRGGSVEWAQAWLAGRLDAAHASALTVAACAVCGAGTIFPRG